MPSTGYNTRDKQSRCRDFVLYSSSTAREIFSNTPSRFVLVYATSFPNILYALFKHMNETIRLSGSQQRRRLPENMSRELRFVDIVRLVSLQSLN